MISRTSFEPSGGSAKFARFHESLRRYGATRALPTEVKSLQGWSYRPLDSAVEIARAVEERLGRRRAMLSGLLVSGPVMGEAMGDVPRG